MKNIKSFVQEYGGKMVSSCFQLKYKNNILKFELQFYGCDLYVKTIETELLY